MKQCIGSRGQFPMGRYRQLPSDAMTKWTNWAGQQNNSVLSRAPWQVWRETVWTTGDDYFQEYRIELIDWIHTVFALMTILLILIQTFLFQLKSLPNHFSLNHPNWLGLGFNFRGYLLHCKSTTRNIKCVRTGIVSLEYEWP